MITEQDLQAAIAECEGERRPNSNTCIKLASFYTIRDHLYPEKQTLPLENVREVAIQPHTDVSYSNAYKYSSDSEFGRIVSKKGVENVMPIIDELMDAIAILQPRLYDGVMRKLNEN